MRFSWFFCCFVGLIKVLFAKGNESLKCYKQDYFSKGLFRSRYIFYDVHPMEGFNLRFDVYLRLAVFLHEIQYEHNWYLVLLPWPRMKHWSRNRLGNDDFNHLIPWRQFFDIDSLKRFAPVIEYDQFCRDNPNPRSRVIDAYFILQHYPDMYEDLTKIEIEDKWDYAACDLKSERKLTYFDNAGKIHETYKLLIKNLECISFYGGTRLLKEVMDSTKHRTVMFDNAEMFIHDKFGTKTYWQGRRSTRYASHLIEKAKEIRRKIFLTNDKLDGIVRPKKWEQEKPGRHAIGGPYLAVHLRRGDFLYGIRESLPSLQNAAHQITEKLELLQLNAVYVATDAEDYEFNELKQWLRSYRVYRFKPRNEDYRKYYDGGIAIIDQIMCAHARFFIGSYDSTFTYRIEEEREILGFPVNSTFNRFCGDNEPHCVYPNSFLIAN